MDGQLWVYGDIKTSRTGKERLAKKTWYIRRNITFTFTCSGKGERMNSSILDLVGKRLIKGDK